jgi:hypothetical protein
MLLLSVLPSLAPAEGLAAERGAKPIEIHVDMSRTPLRIMHARLLMPVVAGPLTLLYPKYMPGEHGPTGPVAELAGLVIRGNGKSIAWNRDTTDVFTFRVDVPTGVSEIEIELDYLPPRTGGMFETVPRPPSRWR